VGGRAATGGLTHIAWFEGDELHVVDVWESAEDFQRFVDGRLMPVVKGELGLEGEPEVTITEAHAHFVPEAVKA
jgi:hypothetical protein